MSVCTCVLPFCDSWSMKVYSLFQPDINVEPERSQMGSGEKKNDNPWISEDSLRPRTVVSQSAQLLACTCACERPSLYFCLLVCLYWLFVQSPTKKEALMHVDGLSHLLSGALYWFRGYTRYYSQGQHVPIRGFGRHRPPPAALMHNCTRPTG